MRHLKHKRVYPDQELRCELCDPPRIFKNYQGLRGHRRMIHSIRDPISASSGPGEVDHGVKNDPVSTNTIEALKEENELLKLQIKNRQLTAQFPATETRPQDKDLMQQLGLGNFDPEVKAAAQRRAMALSDQEKPPGWLEKVLSNPEGLRIAIEGLKGILGTNNNNQGDGMATLLKDLGFNLRDLILGATAPKSGSMSIAGVDLTGTSLTPELLQGILQYKSAEVKAAADLEGRREMADTLKGAMKTIGEGIGSGAISLGKFGPGRHIGREITPHSAEPGDPGVEGIFNCPACGFENKLPIDIGPGVEIHCQGPDCKQTWITEDHQARQPKPKREKKQVKVDPPIVEETACPGCGQLINLDNRSIGEIVKCPACEDEVTVTSEILAAPAQDLSENEKHRKQFLRNGYGGV